MPQPSANPDNEAVAPAVLSVEAAKDLKQQDRADWMVLPMLFNRLSHMYGPYSLDACAVYSGTKAQCQHFWSMLDDCTKQDWSGHNAWCKPPFHDVYPILKRFLECKKKAPTRTSATFILPYWEGAS